MEAILIAFLSGAMGGAIITAIYDFLSEKHIRKINYLRSQIDNLYGPVYFVLINSENVLEISKNIVDAGGQVYARDYGQVPAHERTEARQLRDQKDISDIFDISNEYAAEAIKNNEKIFNIISDNCSYIDLDDVEVVDSFVRNYSRLKTEYLAKKNLPYEVYKGVGDISILQDKFKKKIAAKFTLKKTQLSESASFFSWFQYCISCLKK